jgi:hypothetical protein
MLRKESMQCTVKEGSKKKNEKKTLKETRKRRGLPGFICTSFMKRNLVRHEALVCEANHPQTRWEAATFEDSNNSKIWKNEL